MMLTPMRTSALAVDLEPACKWLYSKKTSVLSFKAKLVKFAVEALLCLLATTVMKRPFKKLLEVAGFIQEI